MAQIAQIDIDRNREDGSTYTFRLTFEKVGGTAQSYNVPLVGEVSIKMGSRNDTRNKVLKTHQIGFKIKGSNEPLIDELAAAGYRDILIRYEEITTKGVLFEGYFVPDQSEFNLYESYQQTKVKGVGQLKNIEVDPVTNANRTLADFADDIGASLGIDRELNVYTDLHHSGQTESDPLPLFLRFNDQLAANNDSSESLLTAAKSVMSALGWQVFQRNGRIVFADVYHRASSPTAVNSHESDGSGGFNNTSTNVLVTLDQSNVIRGGTLEQAKPVIDYRHNFVLNSRDQIIFNNNVGGTGVLSQGLVRSGDVISYKSNGRLEYSDNGQDEIGTLKHTEVKLLDKVSGATLWYDFDNDQWVESQHYDKYSFGFTSGFGDQTQDFGNETYFNLAPVPEGVIADLEMVQSVNYDMQTGTGSNVSTIFEEMALIFEVNDDADAIRHTYQALSSLPETQRIESSFFISDDDLYTSKQTFEYIQQSGGIWTATSSWVSDTGNGTLPAVVRTRLGNVLVGEGVRFDVRIRDIEDVDLLTVFNIDDNDGVTHTVLPLEIVYRSLKGYYDVRVKEYFDQLDSVDDFYQAGGAGEAGTSTSTGGSSGSAVWGQITGTLSNQTDLQSVLDNKADLDEAETFQEIITFLKSILINGDIDFDETSKEKAIRWKDSDWDSGDYIEIKQTGTSIPEIVVVFHDESASSDVTLLTIKADGVVRVGSGQFEAAQGAVINQFLQIPVGTDKF